METPRTDKEAEKTNADCYLDGYVTAEFAQELEAELSTLRAENERSREIEDAARQILAFLPSDNKERPDNERIPSSYNYVRWGDVHRLRAALARRGQEGEG